MDPQTRRTVRERAGDRCEYCGLRQNQSPLATLHVEHIIPRKHGGTDSLENLALACIDCNLHKGPNLAGYDPATGRLTPLFHPRRDLWSEHFARQEFLIVGKTASGRTTVAVLDLNSEERIQLRMHSAE
jgi:5-methylcytosine-specific restriction endonuclease McrA